MSPAELHADSIVIDGLIIAKWNRELFEDMRKGGLTAANCTVSVWEGFQATINNIAASQKLIRENSDLVIPVRTTADIRKAKEQGKAYDVEDSAFAMIRFADGAMLDLEASWAVNQGPNEFMETRLYGTEGGLIQNNVGEGYDFSSTIHVEKSGVQYDLSPHAPIPAVKSSYDHFIEAIRTNTPHTATGEEGLLVMEILDAVYASTERGEPVKIG